MGAVQGAQALTTGLAARKETEIIITDNILKRMKIRREHQKRKMIHPKMYLTL